MYTTTEVAEVMGVSPARIRQQAIARRDADRHDLMIHSLGIIPKPAEYAGALRSAPLYDEREILRWRAHREGGDLTRRVELFAHSREGENNVVYALFEVLRYPHTEDFREWLFAKLDKETEGTN